MAELLKESRLLTKDHFTTLYMPEAERENYGTKTGEDALQDKVVGLFFSASWCPPCQHFVPALRDVYDELVQREEPFEVVFVSMDKSKEEMLDYYREKQGKWLALKYGDPMKESLVEKFHVSVIPKLIVLRPDGEVITTKGRKDVQDKGLISFRAWHSAMLAAAKKADQQNQQQQQQLQEQMEAEERSAAEASSS
ncbi:nucleoredoxin-like protein 2 [Babylonia areolata]|uniref:nucleoredoxin-like protein 2 n=1 Tax=Babylonia areolata TaxID=304850 RepID=UPI003FD5D9B5